MSDRKDIPLLPERVPQHPIRHYSKYLLDRFRVVSLLWDNFHAPDPASNGNLYDLVSAKLQEEEIFFTEQIIENYSDALTGKPCTVVYQHDRPSWTNGVPSHNMAIPIVTTPDVVAAGVDWYTKLYPHFQQAIEFLKDEWGKETKISYLLDIFKQRLIDIYSGQITDYPGNWLDPPILVNYLLDYDEHHSFTIETPNVTINGQLPQSEEDNKLIREIGDKIASDRQNTKLPFNSAVKTVLMEDLT